VAAATASNVSAFALDPTIQEVNAVYVLTLTSAGGVGSIAYGVGTAMDATTFEIMATTYSVAQAPTSVILTGTGTTHPFTYAPKKAGISSCFPWHGE